MSKLINGTFSEKIKLFSEDKGSSNIISNNELEHLLRNIRYSYPCSKNDHYKKHIKKDESFSQIQTQVTQQNFIQPLIR